MDRKLLAGFLLGFLLACLLKTGPWIPWERIVLAVVTVALLLVLKPVIEWIANGVPIRWRH